jgi:hypothetical protein
MRDAVPVLAGSLVAPPLHLETPRRHIPALDDLGRHDEFVETAHALLDARSEHEAERQRWRHRMDQIFPRRCAG